MLEGLVDWVVQNVGRPGLNAGIIMVCFIMLAARANLLLIGSVAAAGLGLANYRAIAGLIGF